MPKLVKQLEALIHIHGPAQVAVWMGYKDHRSIQQWVKRKTIPKVRVLKVQQVIYEKGAARERTIIRRSKGQKEATT